MDKDPQKDISFFPTSYNLSSSISSTSSSTFVQNYTFYDPDRNLSSVTCSSFAIINNNSNNMINTNAVTSENCSCSCLSRCSSPLSCFLTSHNTLQSSFTTLSISSPLNSFSASSSILPLNNNSFLSNFVFSVSSSLSVSSNEKVANTFFSSASSSVPSCTLSSASSSFHKNAKLQINNNTLASHSSSLQLSQNKSTLSFHNFSINTAFFSSPSYSTNISNISADNEISNAQKNFSTPYIDILAEQLRRKEIRGSHFVGKKTAEVLRKLVDRYPWNNTQQLVSIVKLKSKELIDAKPMEFVVANVIKRILCIIRAEHYKHLDNQSRISPQFSSLVDPLQLHLSSFSTSLPISHFSSSFSSFSSHKKNKKESSWMYQRYNPSMSTYFDPYAADAQDLTLPLSGTVKHSIFEGISELIAEIDYPWEESDQRASFEFFGHCDVILTYGYSMAVQKLLKTVSKKKERILVIVAGGDLEGGGEHMAESLCADGVETTFISDFAVFAVMARVDKVVLGTIAALSTGGIVTVGGAHNVAQAAHEFSKPVIAVSPLFKLTYLPFLDPLKQNELLPPAFFFAETGKIERVSVRIPMYDFIPSKLLTIFITDIGPIDPAFLYTLTKQRYHFDDLDLSSL